MDALEIRHVRHGQMHQIVGASREQMAGEDFLDALHRLLERLKRLA
jgi:hypothetical protein